MLFMQQPLRMHAHLSSLAASALESHKFTCAQVVAISKPLKLTYSWGKPAKRPVSTYAPPPLAARERSEPAALATRPLSASDATAAAAPAAFAGPPPASPAWANAGGAGMVRRLLQRGDLGDASRFKGQQVEVFWPQDGTWWLARVIKVRKGVSWWFPLAQQSPP
jgi:hypothetical protein